MESRQEKLIGQSGTQRENKMTVSTTLGGDWFAEPWRLWRGYADVEWRRSNLSQLAPIE